MADVVTKILDVQVNVDKAIEKMVEYKKEVQRLRQEQAELRKAQKEDPTNAEKYARDIENLSAQISVYNDAIRKTTKVVQNQIRQEESQKGSIIAMRAELSNLTAEYDSLGEAQRRGIAGSELKQRINDITTALKAEEEATQRYYRNVGNYENAIRDALGNLNSRLTEAQRRYAELLKTEGSASKATREAKEEFEDLQLTLKFTEETTESFNNAIYSFIPGGNILMKIVPLIGSGLSGVGKAFSLAVTGAKALGQQLLTLMANPIVAFLGVMASIIMLVANGIKGSEENMNQWNRILAPLQRELAALQGVLTTLAGWILNVVEFGERALLAVFKFAEAATSIFPSLQNAIKGVNAAIEESIELAAREAKLDRDRGDFLVEEAKQELEIAKLREIANNKEGKTAEERLAANNEAIRIERQLAEERLRMAEEEFAIAKTRAEWSDNSKEDNDELSRLEAEVYNARKSYYDNTMKLQKQQQTLENEIASERKAQHEAYRKQQEERIRLAKEASEKEAAAYRMLEDALLQLVEEGFDKKRQTVNLQYDREIKDLKKRLDTEKNLTERARKAITDTIKVKERQRQQELNSISEEEIQKEVERQEKLISTRLSAVEKGSKEERELRLMQLEISKQLELAQYEDDEEMKTAILAKYAQERFDIVTEYSDAELERQKKQAEEEKKILEQKQKANEAAVKSLSDGFKAMGEQNKAFAKMSKVIALGQIAISSGKAIAEGTAQAQSVPFPANLAAIATTVGTILANIATAISTVKSAKFATGGKVTGAGTGTSDSIPAWLSNGEFVINAKATSRNEPLLRAINSGVQPTVILPSSYGGDAVQSAEQGKSLVEAIENLQPVVAIEDINDGQARVKIIQNLGNL